MFCKYCGKWVGLFKSAHEECEKAYLQKQAEIEKERERQLSLIDSSVTSIVNGKNEFASLREVINSHNEESVLSLEEIASRMYDVFAKQLTILLTRDLLNEKVYKQIDQMKAFFEKLGQSELYKDAIKSLYTESLKLSLEGTFPIQKAYDLTLEIYDHFQDEEFSSEFFNCEENAILLWANEHISRNDLFISDEQYEAIESYADQYNQVILGTPYDDSMLYNSIRLQSAYILNKLRHNEYLENDENVYQLDRAREHVILNKGEHLVWEIESASAYQSKTRKRYVGSSGGASMRIAKGLYVRTGGYEGYTIDEQTEDFLGCGDIAITTDKLVFYVTYEGGHSIRIPFNKIIAIKSITNGFIIEQESKKDIRFECEEWCDEKYYFLLKVMQIDPKELGPRRAISSHIDKEERIESSYDSSCEEDEQEEKPKKTKGKSKKNTPKPEDLPYLSTISLCDVIMNDKLLKKAFNAINKLFNFYEKKCYEQKFTDLISQVFPPTEQYLGYAMLREVFECIKGIGAKLDVYTPHGIIAVMAIERMRHNEFCEFTDFAVLQKKDLKSYQSVLDHVESGFSSLTGVDTFLYAHAFSFLSKANQCKYIDLMADLTNVLLMVGSPDSEKSVKFQMHLQELKSITKGKMEES